MSGPGAVCRPDLGLHTVDTQCDRELSHTPGTQWVLVQRCCGCGLVLNKVSKHKGLMLAAGVHVLVHWVWELKLMLGPKDAERLMAMSTDKAVAHLSEKLWGGLAFVDPPDLSRHPSSVARRVARIEEALR